MVFDPRVLVLALLLRWPLIPGMHPSLVLPSMLPFTLLFPVHPLPALLPLRSESACLWLQAQSQSQPQPHLLGPSVLTKRAVPAIALEQCISAASLRLANRAPALLLPWRSS